jgi:hypothetical protein
MPFIAYRRRRLGETAEIGAAYIWGQQFRHFRANGEAAAVNPYDVAVGVRTARLELRHLLHRNLQAGTAVAPALTPARAGVTVTPW